MGLCAAYGEPSIQKMKTLRNGYETALCAGMAFAMGGLGSTLSIGDFTDLIEYPVSLKNVGG